MSIDQPIAVTGMHAADNPSPGVGVARCLAQAGYRVLGFCYSAIETGSHVPGVFERVYRCPRPDAGTRGYLARIAEVMGQNRALAVIPTLEPEIMLFARNRTELESAGVRALVPRPESLERTRKLVLAELGRSCGFRVPPLVPAATLKEASREARRFGLPVMLKGAWYEAYRIEHLDEIPALFRRLKRRWGLPVLVQPCALGSEAVVACLCDRPGRLARTLSLRKLGMSDQGTTWCAVTFRNDALLEACSDLLAELKWLGPCEVEVLMDESSGMFTLLEVNARFPSWIGVSAELGTNLPGDLVRVLTGEPLGPDPGYAAGRIMVRQILDRTVPLARLLQLDVGGSTDGC